MGASGTFYLGGTGGALLWDGSDLTISGTVYASAGSFTGNIAAASGNIGNWNIVDGELSYGTDIVLDATNKAIYIADTTYGNAGIQLEFNSGSPRAYIGDGTKFIKFDGDDLTWNGGNTSLDNTGKLTTISADIGG